MSEGSSSKVLMWVVLGAVALVVILLATGVIDFSSRGGELPEVQVEAGELPDVDADVADVDVGSKNVTVEVPDVDVAPANAEAEGND